MIEHVKYSDPEPIQFITGIHTFSRKFFSEDCVFPVCEGKKHLRGIVLVKHKDQEKILEMTGGVLKDILEWNLNNIKSETGIKRMHPHDVSGCIALLGTKDFKKFKAPCIKTILNVAPDKNAVIGWKKLMKEFREFPTVEDYYQAKKNLGQSYSTIKLRKEMRKVHFESMK
jgi:hypothetical protein